MIKDYFLQIQINSVKPIMNSRLRSANDLQILDQDHGKELQEIHDLLSKVKVGERDGINYLKKIDSRYAIFFRTDRNNPLMIKAKEHYIKTLKGWIRYEDQQQSRQSSLDSVLQQKFLPNILERMVCYSGVGRFSFLPKQVQCNIQELKETTQQIIFKLIKEVRSCLFPDVKSDKLMKNHDNLTIFFKQLHLIKTNRFLKIQVFQYLQELLLQKKRLSWQYLSSFQSKPGNLQVFYQYWQQAKLLDIIMKDNDKTLSQYYLQSLSAYFQEQVGVLQTCSRDLFLFSQTINSLIIKFKHCVELNLEQMFQLAINDFKVAQWNKIIKLGNDFQQRHLVWKALLGLKLRIANYFPNEIDKLINSVAFKNLETIFYALEWKKCGQDALIKYQSICMEVRKYLGQDNIFIQKLRLKVLAKIEEKRNEMSIKAATGMKEQTTFAPRGVLIVMGEQGRIDVKIINNSYVSIAQQINKLPIQTNAQ